MYKDIYLTSSLSVHSMMDIGCFCLSCCEQCCCEWGRRVQITFQVSVFLSFGYIPQSGITTLYVTSSFSFLGLCTVPAVAVPVYSVCWQQRTGVFFSPRPCHHLWRFVGDGCSKRYEVLCHCGVNLQFPNDCQHLFHGPFSC